MATAAETKRMLISLINKSIVFTRKLREDGDPDLVAALVFVGKLLKVSPQGKYIVSYDANNWFECESKFRCITDAIVASQKVQARRIGFLDERPVYIFTVNGIGISLFMQDNTFMNMLSVSERHLAEVLFDTFAIYYSNPAAPQFIDVFEESALNILGTDEPMPAADSLRSESLRSEKKSKTLRWRNVLENVREFSGGRLGLGRRRRHRYSRVGKKTRRKSRRSN